MTLVIAATGRESIWIAADRRLSEHGKPVADDAIKILRLERSDDVALLAYSGLGRTPDGIQPSDWMNAVLRDRNEALVRSLEILVRAIDTQIPKYMFRVPGIGNSAHVVLAPAFVSEKPTLYTLKLDIDAKAKQHHTSVAPSDELHSTLRPSPQCGDPAILRRFPPAVAHHHDDDHDATGVSQ